LANQAFPGVNLMVGRFAMNQLTLRVTKLILFCVLFGLLLPAAANSFGVRRGPYLIVAAEDNWKWSPAVAYASQHDEYLVVWETWEANGHHAIYGRRVSPLGQMFSEFLIYSGQYNSLQPTVAYDVTHDRYLVVWAYDSTGDGTDGDIYGRFIPWNGPSASEAAFGIDVSRANLDKPKLAYSPTSDEFLIIWRVLPGLDNLYAIAGGIIYNDKTGKPISISSGLEPRDFPDLAYNLVRNEFVVVWDMDVGRDEQDLDIYAMRLDFSGAPMPPGEFAVATLTSNEQHPTVAACYNADKYLIAWQQQVNQTTDDNIFARMMSGTGLLGQSYGVAGTTLPQQHPRLACNPGGNEFFLAWDDQYAQPYPRRGVWAEVIHTDFWVEPAFEVVRPSDTRDRLFPAVAYGDKTALVVWQHARDNSNWLDIWGQVVWPNTIFLPLVVK
jgi:hypothetical protein